MASCTSYALSGLNAGCKDSVGGVAKVWLADASDIKWTISNDGTIAPTGGITSDWKVYNLRRGAGSMTSTLTVNDNAGSYFTTEVAMNFLKMENAKRIEVMAMLMGQCTGVVKDRNGKYWAIGVENPLEGSAGTGETGTAAADANQYTVTISVDESELPREITDASVIADLEAITIV
jgi:hypothetical protein